jgi:hypothetical protein
MAIVAIVGKSVSGRKLFLRDTMLKLFEIASMTVSQSKDHLDLPQVHAINVIRTILHDSDVAEESQSFISDAFELCISGISSTYFPIRNCSVMLFSVLVSKSLGGNVIRRFFTI